MSLIDWQAADAPPTIPAGHKPPSLGAFVAETALVTLEPWQEKICARLEQLVDQQGQRLLIHGAPQFGKSLILSQRLPAYMLGRRPRTRIRLACYNETHAERFSAVNLELMRDASFHQAFPQPGARVPDRCPVGEWSTAARRTQRDANPSLKALGLGTGFVGLGADLVLIDDPYKNREEAFSPTTNAGIWGWWQDVVLPRLNPATNVVVMFHRWHQDDFAGRLLDQGGWELWRFPAIADGLDDDRSGLPVGEPLSPRYPLAYLESIRAQQGLSFQALYQGTPAPASGNLINPAWFGTPVAAAPVVARRARYWDLAGAAAGAGDWTVGVRMAVTPDWRWFVEHVERFQLPAHLRDARIEQVAAMDRCPQVIEQPPGLANEPVKALIRKLHQYTVYADLVHRDKVSRAEPFASQAQAGNISIVAGAWNRAWLEELALFPAGKHDDQVDGTTGGYNWLADSATATEQSNYLTSPVAALDEDEETPWRS